MNKQSDLNMNRSVAQFPLAFPRNIRQQHFNIDTKEYRGFELKVGNDIRYAIGSPISFEERLPSKQDLLVLLYLLRQSQIKDNAHILRFANKTALLAEAGMGNTGRDYARLQETLTRWRSMAIHHRYTYRAAKVKGESSARGKRGEGKTRLYDLVLSSVLIKHERVWGAYEIQVNPGLLEWLRPSFYCKINLDMLSEMDSTYAVNLYMWLRSWSNAIEKQAVEIDFDSLMHRLGMGGRQKRKRSEQHLQTAVREINRAITNNHIYTVEWGRRSGKLRFESIHRVRLLK